MRSVTVWEAQALRIVAASTNCNGRQLDPGGGAAQLPDFELVNHAGNRLGVLEVTAAVDGARAAGHLVKMRLRLGYRFCKRASQVQLHRRAPDGSSCPQS